jgi:parallel beta-helix repeat protein
VNIIDLGAGVNVFSYPYLLEQEKNINYISIEAIGHLVELANNYLQKNKFQGKAYCFDLFDSGNIKKINNIVGNLEGLKVVFLLKMIGPIETIKRDYTKELLLNLKEDIDIFVLSFATKTLSKKLRFQVNRKWLLDFLKENFKILDDFEISGERFIIFRNN